MAWLQTESIDVDGKTYEILAVRNTEFFPLYNFTLDEKGRVERVACISAGGPQTIYERGANPELLITYTRQKEGGRFTNSPCEVLHIDSIDDCMIAGMFVGGDGDDFEVLLESYDMRQIEL